MIHTASARIRICRPISATSGGRHEPSSQGLAGGLDADSCLTTCGLPGRPPPEYRALNQGIPGSSTFPDVVGHTRPGGVC
jgi:hypothetical protein